MTTDEPRLVCFLDIDGVLNSVRYWFANKPIALSTQGAIDPDAVKVLNQIVDRWNPYIVLSSSWRKFGLEHTQEMLALQGFTGQLMSETSMMNTEFRHEEIDAWLRDSYGLWSRYFVIDDDPTAWNSGEFVDQGFLLSTNYGMGLVQEHLPLLRNWIEGPPPSAIPQDEIIFSNRGVELSNDFWLEVTTSQTILWSSKSGPLVNLRPIQIRLAQALLAMVQGSKT